MTSQIFILEKSLWQPCGRWVEKEREEEGSPVRRLNQEARLDTIQGWKANSTSASLPNPFPFWLDYISQSSGQVRQCYSIWSRGMWAEVRYMLHMNLFLPFLPQSASQMCGYQVDLATMCGGKSLHGAGSLIEFIE